jgi:arylsulfatase A-like enzyme
MPRILPGPWTCDHACPIVRAMRTVLLAAVVLFGCQSSSQDEAVSEPLGPPNILFLFTDDHAAHSIGAYGSIYPNVTPNIDRIANEGILFSNMFCGNSICSPSRATILTGMHSHVNGIHGNAETFDGSQPTFPKYLQSAGYQTAMLGKWHLKSDPTGFDHWEVLPGQGHYYNPDFRTPAGKHRREGYVTNIITDLALDWLKDERDPDKPFLMMVQHKAPHREWMPGPDHHQLFEGEDLPEPATLFDDYRGRATAAAENEMSVANHLWEFYDLKVEPLEGAELSGPDRWAGGRLDRMTPEHRAAWEAAYGPRNAAFRAADLEGEDLVRWKYQRYMKDYLRCVAAVDDGIGELLAALDELGLAENTLVVYSSDQGFYLGDHGWYDKRWMYEESLRMPFVARWPGVIEPGLREERLAQNIDFAPTFLELAGFASPTETHGKSFAPMLTGAPLSSWRDAVYYHYTEYPQPHRVARHYGVRTDRYKLISYYERGEWELFDLTADPDELQSVYDDPEYTEVRAGLTQRLKELQLEYGDQ